MYKALVAPFDLSEAQACADHDWAIDARLLQTPPDRRQDDENVIDRSMLHDALFDLAATWVHGVSAQEIAAFLARGAEDRDAEKRRRIGVVVASLAIVGRRQCQLRVPEGLLEPDLRGS